MPLEQPVPAEPVPLEQPVLPEHFGAAVAADGPPGAARSSEPEPPVPPEPQRPVPPE